MPKVTSYENIDAMFADMTRAREQADAAVDPRQQAIGVGDCFMRWVPDEDLVIYGEVIDPLAFYEGKDLDANDGELRAEMEYEKQLRSEPHMKYFRFSKCYSPVVEDGELGDVHVATVMPVSRDVFEAAQQKGWPQRPQDGLEEKLFFALISLFRGTRPNNGEDHT